MSVPTIEITIDNKKYPVRYPLSAISELEKILGQPCFLGLPKLDTYSIMAAVYVGIKTGCKCEGVEFDFKDIDDLGDRLTLDDPELVRCMKLFNESQGRGEHKKEGEEKTEPAGESVGIA